LTAKARERLHDPLRYRLAEEAMVGADRLMRFERVD
jgi:hypothetical protein